MVIIIALSEITRAFPMLSSSFPPIAPDLRKLFDTHTFHGTRLWRERLVVISLIELNFLHIFLGIWLCFGLFSFFVSTLRLIKNDVKPSLRMFPGFSPLTVYHLLYNFLPLTPLSNLL